MINRNLTEMENVLGCKLFIVGGYVRDLFIGRRSKDIDIVCVGVALEKACKYLSKFGSSKMTKANNNDVLIFKDETGDEIQITSPKGCGNNTETILHKDAVMRDFRINSMYIPISEVNNKGSFVILDFVEGRKDIDLRVVDFNKDCKALIEVSPIRMLRAVSIAAKLDFVIGPRTVDAIRLYAHKIRKCPQEAIAAEINDILLAKTPSKYINILRDTGLLKFVLPEVDACFGVAQSIEHHKYDVYNHIIRVVDNSDSCLTLRLAALLHDVGKPATKKVTNGKATFHSHEAAGACVARKVLTRLKYSNEIITQVTGLVTHHMYHYDRSWTDSAVRRFIRTVGMNEEYLTADAISSFPLFRLRVADRLGNGLKPNPITPKQLDFEKRLVKLFAESNCLSVKNLAINGKDIMAVFKVKPGAIIGHVLNKLLEAVIDNPSLNNREALIEMSRSIMEDFLTSMPFELG